MCALPYTHPQGHPKVFEYTSEFSEFLKKSAHVINKESATALFEPGPLRSPAHQAQDDVAQSQDPIVPPLSVSSSTVLVKPFSNSSESETSTNLQPSSTLHSPQKQSIFSSSPEPPVGLESESINVEEKSRREKSSGRELQSAASVFDETHCDIILFPRMNSSLSSPSSPIQQTPSPDCVPPEESLNTEGRSKSVIREIENKEASCDKRLEASESSALLVPFQEQLTNPSPDLEFSQDEPEIVYVKEGVSQGLNRSAFQPKTKLDQEPVSSLVSVPLSPQSSRIPDLQFVTQNSTAAVTPTPPVISYAHSHQEALPQQELSSQLHIQIHPYARPSSGRLDSQAQNYHESQNVIGGQHNVAESYGTSQTFNTVSTSGYNYSHVSSPTKTAGFENHSHPSQHSFTNDPGLFSQFLEYAEAHPLGESPAVRHSLDINKSPTGSNLSLPNDGTGTIYPQHRHTNISSPITSNSYGGIKVPETSPNSRSIFPPQSTASQYSSTNEMMKVPHPQPYSYIQPHHQTKALPSPIRAVDRSQYENHLSHQPFRPCLQVPRGERSPLLHSPNHLPRVLPHPSWIPHARAHVPTHYGPVQASIHPSPNIEQNRTEYYPPQHPSQLPVQMRVHGQHAQQGHSTSTLRKNIPYTGGYEIYEKSYNYGARYPPPIPVSSHLNFHHVGIPSHSTVVGQIPPIVVSGQGQLPSQVSTPAHPSSNFAQYSGSIYRDHNSSFSGRGQSSASNYYGHQSTRFSIAEGQPQMGGGSYPVVCRVTPIRSRLEPPHSQERGYPHSFPKGPYIPRMSPSFSSQQGLPSASHRLDYDSYNYSCEYSDAMRRLSTQFTLQALPGLPPGAQGHHLLVKTENGQYQLLRVGPPPSSAPTAASGTPSPSSQSPQTPVPTTTAVVVQVSSSSIPTTATATPPTPSVPPPTTQNNTAGAGAKGTAKTFVVLNSSSGGVVGPTVLTLNPVSSSPTPTKSVAPSSGPVATTSVTPPTTAPVFITSSSVNTNHSSISSNLSVSIPRLQTPTVPPAPATNSPSGVGMTASMSMQQQMHPFQLVTPPHSQALNSRLPSSALTSTTALSSTATATTVSQMTPDTAKQKCKNFLSFLLELSAKQNQTVARNVRGLIQGLVDGKVNAEDFSDRLQKEVNSQPQPCLVGFLKKSLPPLRQSLANKELTIDGIRPPPISSLTTPVPPPQPLLSQQVRSPAPIQTTPVRIITPIHTNSFPSASPVMPSTTPIPRSTVAAVQQRFAAPPKASPKASKSSTKDRADGSPSTPKSAGSKGKEKQDKKSFASSGNFGGDDDINDVAAMGGVNLAEESQRILGSTDMIGTQIRSCRDEPLLQGTSLQAKIRAIAARHGLEEPSPEVAAMISHATEERVKTMLEKLSLIAEHRLDVIKLENKYEVTQDVKGQLRFLEELEKLERKRHDEQEREMLIKAAKSRSKSEDPEQAKLKAKAKEMQRVAQEEMRQREANLTALQAIGPRKKPKLDTSLGSQSTSAQSPAAGLGALSNASRPHIPMRPRLKRVNIRDVMFLLEQEGETSRSHYLYKHLLK